jgi:hypothetical protein
VNDKIGDKRVRRKTRMRTWLETLTAEERQSVPPATLERAVDPHLSRQQKRARDRDREKYRRRKPRVQKAQPAELVPFSREHVEMLEALHQFVLNGIDYMGQRKAPADLLDSIEAAHGAVFGGTVHFRWAWELVLVIGSLHEMAERSRTKMLSLEPAQLLHAARAQSIPPSIPGYVTRSLVQWAFRSYTPSGHGGGGRLADKALAALLTHPEALADAVDDKECARAIRRWIGANRSEQPRGWYWGKDLPRIR